MSEKQRIILANQAARGSEQARQDLLCSLSADEGTGLSARERFSIYLAIAVASLSARKRPRR
jgi:hypothetical protein